MAQGYYSDKFVLHTHSDYFHPEIPEGFLDTSNLINNTEWIDQRIKFLEEQEKAFYKTYGASNFEEFIIKMRTIFSSLPQDAEVIRMFSNEKIKSIVKSRFFNFKSKNFQEQEIIIKVKEDSGLDLTQIDWGKNVTVKNKLYLKGKFSVSQLKQIANLIQEKEQISKRHRLRDKKDTDLSTLNKYLPEFDKYMDFYLSDSRENNAQIYMTKRRVEDTLWGLTKDSIDKKKSSEKGLAELQDFYNELESFIIYEIPSRVSNPSLTLIEAIKATFYSKIDPEEFASMRFFGGAAGKNYMNTIIGALGEFQTALIFNYIQMLGHANNPKLAKIIGDSLNTRKQQIKSDVQIMENFNVQVKNHNPYNITKDKDFPIDFSLSATDFKNYGIKDETFQNFFSQIIANACFNQDVTASNRATISDAITTIENYLGIHFMELLSSALLEYTGEMAINKVTFYFISGKFLVPMSYIYKAQLRRLEWLRDFDEGNIVEVTLPPFNPIGSNSLFQEDQEERAIYWTGNSQIGWTPTSKNYSKFTNLVDNYSLKAEVSKRFLTMDEFSIF